ncbi:MAG: GspE/PulE family protein [Patescibacteria group bacterium]
MHEQSASEVLHTIFKRAYEENASDIHIDPTEHHIKIQMRVDGILITQDPLPKFLHEQLILLIKIRARLRTDEHLTSQDGRLRISISTSLYIEARVSLLPTFYGENAVIRLLKETFAAQSLSSLGLSKIDEGKISRALKKRHGMILVTGPTGSGKTTTLYTILKQLNNSTQAIITLEDPVEYTLPGIRQIPVSPHLHFNNGLRALVRQDPDIIMVGEIRDSDTAHVAVHTALTGHLLLSTIHTSNSVTALPRLLDMGVDPYLVASTLEIVIAQRLVRKLCTYCKNNTGCEQCNFTCYKERIGIYEVLVITDALRAAIMNRTSSAELQKIAEREAMTPMHDNGSTLVAEGITTHEELARVLYE